MNLASIPSPSQAVWQLGPIPIRAYALCIITGIVVACIVTDRRMRARGAQPWSVLDIAVWAVPFGIVGARIYHVITTPDKYFGANGHLVDALKIWEGGLGIWGGVAGGALGAWIACKQLRMPFTFVADTIAVGLPLAQGIGRWGNWFNNELYGGRTTLPWGLEVHAMDPANPGNAQIIDGQAQLLPGTYHPTFLYESLWDFGTAGVVFWLDRRLKLGAGRAFALYVMVYTLGRGWIEAMRTDEAQQVLGMRLNVWTSIVVFLGALAYFLIRKGPQEFLLPAAEGEKGYRVVTEAEFLAAQAGEGSADEADSRAAEVAPERTPQVSAGKEPDEIEDVAEDVSAGSEKTTAKD